MTDCSLCATQIKSFIKPLENRIRGMNGFNESEMYRLACGLDGNPGNLRILKLYLALKIQHLRISHRSPAPAPVHLAAKDNIVSNKN